MRGRFGARVDRDAAARLHELAEGWPLGLQLALSVMAAGGDPQAEISVPSTQAGVLHDRFVNLLLANLDAGDVAFLTRISILDVLHAELCASVAAADDAAERLARLARDTPVFAAGEASDWLRMHALARDELRAPLRAVAARGAGRRCTARAAEALAAQGLFEAAALHALAAGRREAAYDLAERSLYESLMTRGGQGAVLEWLERLPAEEVDRRPRLLLAAAWSLALSERHDEASLFLERILARPGIDAALRCECALIQSGAAVYADDPDRFATLHDPWADDPPLQRPDAAAGACQPLGVPNADRRRAGARAPAPAAGPARRAGRGAGLSRPLGRFHRRAVLPVGRPGAAGREAAAADARARRGRSRRRSPFACADGGAARRGILGAQRPARPATCSPTVSTCSNAVRFPKPCCSASARWRASRSAEGAEHRALELLGALDAVGVARSCRAFASPAWASRCACMRAGSGPRPAATCARRSMPCWPRRTRRRGRSGAATSRCCARSRSAYAAIAAQDWRRAADILARADALAQGSSSAAAHRAARAARLGARPLRREVAPLLREAVDLAPTFGLLRVFDDAHPALGDWARQALPARAGAVPGPSRPGARRRRSHAARPAPARATPSMALTPKEREVLELLARHLSNKEIGLSMQVGEETIKWHMKNLFAKLDAGTRKQVVQRARILGLLEAEP